VIRLSISFVFGFTALLMELEIHASTFPTRSKADDTDNANLLSDTMTTKKTNTCTPKLEQHMIGTKCDTMSGNLPLQLEEQQSTYWNEDLSFGHQQSDSVRNPVTLKHSSYKHRPRPSDGSNTTTAISKSLLNNNCADIVPIFSNTSSTGGSCHSTRLRRRSYTVDSPATTSPLHMSTSFFPHNSAREESNHADRRLRVSLDAGMTILRKWVKSRGSTSSTSSAPTSNQNMIPSTRVISPLYRSNHLSQDFNSSSETQSDSMGGAPFDYGGTHVVTRAAYSIPSSRRSDHATESLSTIAPSSMSVGRASSIGCEIEDFEADDLTDVYGAHDWSNNTGHYSSPPGLRSPPSLTSPSATVLHPSIREEDESDDLDCDEELGRQRSLSEPDAIRLRHFLVDRVVNADSRSSVAAPAVPLLHELLLNQPEQQSHVTTRRRRRRADSDNLTPNLSSSAAAALYSPLLSSTLESQWARMQQHAAEASLEGCDLLTGSKVSNINNIACGRIPQCWDQTPVEHLPPTAFMLNSVNLTHSHSSEATGDDGNASPLSFVNDAIAPAEGLHETNSPPSVGAASAATNSTRLPESHPHGLVSSSSGRRDTPSGRGNDERLARMRWIRINRRFQYVITMVALLFSFLLGAILICWVVFTTAYMISFDKACNVPIKPYYWLVTFQLVLDVFRSDIMRALFNWDPSSTQRVPCRVIAYNMAYLLFAVLVLRLGFRSVFIEDSTCQKTAPELFNTAIAFVSLSLAAWSTIICGYLIPFCVVAALLTYNGYNPSSSSLNESGDNGTQPVFPSAYSTTGAPPGCVELLPVIRREDFPPHYPMECCICMEEFNAHDVNVETGCKHVFHKQCCREWLRQARSCPVCREDIPNMIEGMNANEGNSIHNQPSPTNVGRIPVGPTGRPVAGILRLLRRAPEGDGSTLNRRTNPTVVTANSTATPDLSIEMISTNAADNP
jgi:hypothetical protein